MSHHLIKSKLFVDSKNSFRICKSSLFSVDLLEDLEDLNEEVDDVQIELDGSHDVFLRTHPSHDHLNHMMSNFKMTQNSLIKHTWVS